MGIIKGVCGGVGKGDSVTAAVTCNSSIELGNDETTQSMREIS